MTEIPSSISQDPTYISPSAQEFIDYMGDLANLDLQSNFEKFSEEVGLNSDMSNHQIVLNCFTNQLGLQILMSEEWRADSDSEPESGSYNTVKYSYEEINEILALEKPEKIIRELETIDLSKEIKALELGLEGKNVQAIQSFVERVHNHINMRISVEDFRTELLSYALVSSLKSGYRQMINKRLYLEKCPCTEALKDVLE